MAVMKDTDYLAHYGILRKSGRYPWGSGSTQTMRNKMFLDTVAELRTKGMSDPDIAKGFGMTTTDLRELRSVAVNEQRQQKINQAQRLKEKGLSNIAIGDRMKLNESSVRSLLAAGKKDKANIHTVTANMLKEQVAKKGFIDVGVNTELHIGVTRTQLNTAIRTLREQGYEIHTVKVDQLGTGKKTELKVLAKPGTTQKQVWENRFNIKQIAETSKDAGRSYSGTQPPISISSKRVGINYDEHGGGKADGVIYVRPGVKDVSIGSARYAQVRVMVDGTHYLKGMAVYKDDLPAGQDLVFNTNKKDTGNKHDAMKELEKDPDNPFGAQIKAGGQMLEKDRKTGEDRVTSVMNKLNEEGDWDKWSKNLPSQMLSKQSPDLVRHQLDLTFERRKAEFEKLSVLTEPVVKKKLLETFSDETDSASAHLKAFHMSRQTTKVLMPISSMKENEVYAPTLHNGERVALVRFPHAGPFEIPQLTVNNRNKEAQKLLGTDAQDVIGIHHKVAERLSGADFDGDYVLAIPNNRGTIKSASPLEGLKDFDPRRAYPPYDGMRTVDGGTWNAKLNKAVWPEGKLPSGSHKQQQMGDVSNLITDMTIRGANSQELARAVRHSMVVIDSEKHHLDYRSSSKDNGIAQLKTKYQGIPTGAKVPSRAGASTLISRAGAEARILQRKPRPAKDGGPIDKDTGRKVFVNTGATFVDRHGQTVRKTESHARLAVTEDAHELSSGNPVEKIYADHSNRLKALANTARKEMVRTKPTPYEPSAKRVYKKQVESLDAKLNIALRNAPLERQAQILAGAVVSQKRRDNPGMDKDDLKKIKNQALEEMRVRTGARKKRIDIEPEEWNAIQAGAISTHKLESILRNSNLDTVRELATPKPKILMSSTNTARAKSMLSAGYTQAEVAAQLGVSLTTLKTGLE